MKTKIFNLIARVTAVATIVSSVAVMSPVKGAELMYASDTMTRLKISEAADHDVRFHSPNAVPAASGITLTFGTAGTAGHFDLTDLVVGDITVNQSSATTTDCAGATYSSSVTVSGATITENAFPTADTVVIDIGTAITAENCVQILLANEHVDNPGEVASYELTIAAGDDNIGVGIPIVDDDQVTVTANVDPSMLFDLDTTTAATFGTVATETAAPYTVDFGTLDPTDGSNNVSGETLTHGDVNYIHMDLSTNATHGAVVTIQNANGTNGMVSTSDGVDNIVNSTGTMADDVENYGFCVGGVQQDSGATMTIAGSYTAATTCTALADGNNTVALSQTAENIITVDGPVSEGEAYLIGSADASVLTEAHDDYVDTLTFIATGTF